ncbi:LysR family transcriptional regulator [Ruegeria aquimaris]|uniref:LysR family transcriptional regulator n=1 Tax=Ruegeria aquimaris TaxID=2984333 RepID=A0ABT3AR24_9RHOB|nr:LysR family transcriptional regulator [Ruegeria sp. XHP0148]MCV2891133.1 LysR family transcriptional regulator [Ruegeria sp. XHP0148]
MNLQQLIVFREVMETGSVSAAARNLNRTQPAISASLKTLEESVGMELFRREGRRLLPVPEAHYLLSEAIEIIDRLHTAEANMAGMRNRARGTLRIVAMPGPSVFLLPDFVSRFKADAGDLNITLSTRSSPQIINLVAAQSFDVGFCDIGFLDTTEDNPQFGLFQSEIIMCNCLCALPLDHPLAGRPVVHARDLDGEKMGALAASHSTHRSTKKAFEQEGIQFDLSVEAQYFVPLLHFVEAGQICTILDPLSAETYRRMNQGKMRVSFARFEPAVPFGYSIVTPKYHPQSLITQQFVSKWSDYVNGVITAEKVLKQPAT